MALQFDRVLTEADALADLCNRAATLYADIQQVLTHNSNLAIDWSAGSTPAYITEVASGVGAGNIQGRAFTRQDVSNAIGSLDWIRKLLANQVMTGSQGDHLGNLNKLALPLG